MALVPHSAMTLNEVIRYARHYTGALADEPPATPGYLELASSYDAAMEALKHRMYLLNLQLGLKPVIIPDAALSYLVIPPARLQAALAEAGPRGRR